MLIATSARHTTPRHSMAASLMTPDPKELGQNLEDDLRVAVATGAAFAELDDEVILLNTETGIYFGLDQVGAAAWRLLAAGTNGSEMLGELQRGYDVPRQTLHADLRELFRELLAAGLVDRQGA
jgi:hypothetical protein